MPIIRKKELGSVLWTFDANSKVQLKRIFNTEDKSKDWPLASTVEKLLRETITDIGHEEFFNQLIKAIAKLNSTTLRFKFIWALKRYPDEPEKIYAIFIEITELNEFELQLLTDHNLVLGEFAGYYIITRFNEMKFFTKAIEFYERFDQLILPDKSVPFLLYGNKTDDDLVLLFYCDVNGNGMLIKSKGNENKISPELEIEILRLGAIIGVDVPQRSAVIKLDPDDEIINEFSASKDNNVLIQKLIPGAFPLYSAKQEDLELVMKTNCVNLGKMIVFDIVAGSWDRHSGNYVIHPSGLNEFSLAEIDFGLFDPSWYPPVDFKQPEDISLDPNTSPPVYGPREGWALIRHPGVNEMVKNCDQRKVIKGIESALQKLKQFSRTHELTDNFSVVLANRIISLFRPKSQVRRLFESELHYLNIDITLFLSILDL